MNESHHDACSEPGIQSGRKKDCIRASVSWKDYLELTKPKVVLLILLTAVVGMYLAPGDGVPLNILLIATIGIGFAAGGAAVVNHIVDQRIDSIMARTYKRPVASGKIESKKAIILAIVLSLSSMILLFFETFSYFLTN